MPHTQTELDVALERIESFDPATAEWVDATPIRQITEATEAIRASEAKQFEAVQIARARGLSWNLIALALGVSRQAARQRFAHRFADTIGD
jgi:tRNA A37 N6-isopentenylltransferase MiaA